MNKKFTFLTLSVPTPNQNKSGFKSAIACSFSENNFSYINLDKFFINMHNLNLKKFILITVINSVKNPDSHYEQMGIKKFSNDNNCKITQLFITSRRFFSLSTFDYLFEENKEKSYEYIFMFEDTNWKNICVSFLTCGIDISGGSNNKKHLLSPLQFKLSLFLICLYGGSQASNVVKKDFHRVFTSEDKKIYSSTPKYAQGLLIDFIKSTENFKSRILADALYTTKIDDLFDSSIEENIPIGEVVKIDKFSTASSFYSPGNNHPGPGCGANKPSSSKGPSRSYTTASTFSRVNWVDAIFVKFNSNLNKEIKDPISIVPITVHPIMMRNVSHNQSIRYCNSSISSIISKGGFVNKVGVHIIKPRHDNFCSPGPGESLSQ